MFQLLLLGAFIDRAHPTRATRRWTGILQRRALRSAQTPPRAHLSLFLLP